MYDECMSHIRTRHVTFMNEACHTNDEVCHMYACGMSHVCTRHVTHMNAACDISSERSGAGQDACDVTHMSAACHKDTNGI